MSELVGAIQHALNADLLRLQSIGHNLSNINTPGFKSQYLVFQSFSNLMNEDVGEARRAITSVEFSQGSMKPTGSNLDLAIEGEGFFIGTIGNTNYYTRAGRLYVSNDGYLKLQNGGKLIGEAGPIRLNSEKFEVKKDGTIISEEQVIDRIKIVTVSNKNALQSIGAGLYTITDDIETVTSEEVTILQSFYEASNVEMMKEMVGLIELGQHYQMSHNVLKAYDSAINTSILTLGKF